MSRTPPDLSPRPTIGRKCFMDTVQSGLVPCKIIGVIRESCGGSDVSQVEVEVTQDHGAYPKGHRVRGRTFIVPRENVRRGEYASRIVGFNWCVTD